MHFKLQKYLFSAFTPSLVNFGCKIILIGLFIYQQFYLFSGISTKENLLHHVGLLNKYVGAFNSIIHKLTEKIR